ncbi:MAG: 4Fe-4S binding protein [Dethiosulfatibacter sp.]|nr:4Fe-4S binding protein [Dethiosulfatibacter sp.]
MYVSVKVSKEKCIGCKICLSTCPEPNVLIYIKEDKMVKVNENRCKGCGLCATVCIKEALSISN